LYTLAETLAAYIKIPTQPPHSRKKGGEPAGKNGGRVGKRIFLYERRSRQRDLIHLSICTIAQACKGNVLFREKIVKNL
jgi:hypothetical protein